MSLRLAGNNKNRKKHLRRTEMKKTELKPKKKMKIIKMKGETR